MLDAICRRIADENTNIYTVCQISAQGTDVKHLRDANACSNSYSVAKAFTMTALGMLWDDGLLDVNERVYPILKDCFPQDYDKRWEEVTVEHAIKHRIGFDRGFLDIDTEDIADYGTDDFLSVVLSRPLQLRPGTVYVYSDAAYYLLSRIVTAKSGQRLDDFLRERLFNLLRFQQVAWSHCPHGYAMGATGLYIRTQDMAKLGWVYLNKGMYEGKRIVSPEWVELALVREYEFSRIRSANAYSNAYAKGGMNGHMLYFSFDKGLSIAWHGCCSRGTGTLDALLFE
ncbi:MAG: serine hydrolase domain-containing protein [Eubacteriales bacterium]